MFVILLVKYLPNLFASSFSFVYVGRVVCLFLCNNVFESWKSIFGSFSEDSILAL